MNYRPLGRTGLTVSALSLGTVSLGVDYGIEAPGQFGRPDDADAIRLLRAAVDRGITLIDTAPTYGDSERLVGLAFGADARVVIATKTPPMQSVPSGTQITDALAASRRALGRETLDIVEIHNATEESLANRAIMDPLLDAKRRGLICALGATVYDEPTALAVIKSGQFDVLQIAFSVLDQRQARQAMPAAAAAGVGIIVRSALLKGALTPKAQWLPEPLAPLREAATRARDRLASGSWERLPEAAMRFCLSAPHVASVLTGARTLAELDAAVAAEAAGPSDDRMRTAAQHLAIDNPDLLDPRSPLWSGVR